MRSGYLIRSAAEGCFKGRRCGQEQARSGGSERRVRAFCGSGLRVGREPLQLVSCRCEFMLLVSVKSMYERLGDGVTLKLRIY